MGLEFCISALVLLSCFGYINSAVHGNVTDQLALLEFKSKITQDPFGVLSSWNGSIHLCHWRGVICSRRHQRVRTLDLKLSELAGYISPHVGNLSFLRNLDLGDNFLSGEIPPEIGRLWRLKNLFLMNNSLSGQIPGSISACSNLIAIGISFNELVGSIPMELGSLSKLLLLFVHANHLTGSIPSSLGNLSAIEKFSATLNNLSGSIPDSLGRLANLKHIGLNANVLSGTIPPSIFNLSSIIDFSVSYNQIHGILPLDLGNTLPNLQTISLSENQFTGSIPTSISNASNLLEFASNANRHTGNVPSLDKLHKLQFFSVTSNHLGSGGGADDLKFLSSLTNATGLQVLAINNNKFAGVLPESIGNFSHELELLLLDGNKISGSIPSGIGNLVSLKRLEVWENQFSGNIPRSIGRLQNLVVLMLVQNKFSGNIPSSLGELKELTKLGLSRNNLEGSIPSSLGKCQKLLLLDLSYNNLNGSIPKEVLSLSSLSIFLNLSHNHFSGPLPTEVGNMNQLGTLDVSNNMLSGQIPSTIGSCIALEILQMRGNFLQGTIPSTFRSLRGITILDLSRNNFSGQIPDFLEGFKLQYLNLSNNNFEGEVPIKGPFKNATTTSVFGNNKLCGGIPEFQLPNCIFKNPKNSRLTTTHKVVISSIFGLLGLVLVCYLLYRYLKQKSSNENSSISQENQQQQILQVSYQTLLKATDGFSPANLIGEGGFGSVYKGTFEIDGTAIAIAVKVFNLLRRGASKTFMAECEALRNIRHRNLVKIITACSSVDSRGDDFKALVYEYMINGSLDEWLHCLIPEEAQRKLNLVQRLNIAIDVACALDYLHHHCETRIVHCDLKPSNVLLDGELIGHVGDFGLTKFVPDKIDNVSAYQSSSIGVRGSVGYIAPVLCNCTHSSELKKSRIWHGMGSEVSISGDVYSYGILLLEMMTGKNPVDEIFSDNFNLHNYALLAFPDRVLEISDPVLFQGGDRDRPLETVAGKILESLIVIFRIGIACSEELPRNRMNIGDVVGELIGARKILAGTGADGERK